MVPNLLYKCSISQIRHREKLVDVAFSCMEYGFSRTHTFLPNMAIHGQVNNECGSSLHSTGVVKEVKTSSLSRMNYGP